MMQVKQITNAELFVKNNDGSMNPLMKFNGDIEYAILNDGTNNSSSLDNLTSLDNPADAEIVIETDLGKYYRCKNRKRFVKLIMSRGVPRNFANTLAKCVSLSDTTYQQFWIKLVFFGIPYLKSFKLHKDDLLPIFRIEFV